MDMYHLLLKKLIFYYFFNIVRLFLELEGEGTDEVSIAEEINGIEALQHLFILTQRAITGSVVRLARIFYLLHQRIGNLRILKREQFLFALAKDVSLRVYDACVEVFPPRRTGNVFGKDVVKL